MKIKLIAATALAVLGTAAAMAKDHRANDSWAAFDDPAQYSAPSRSRAEVIAELEVWQRSGLARLERSYEPDIYSEQYRVAQARFNAMRTSPQFAARVQAIASARGETSTVAAAKAVGN